MAREDVYQFGFQWRIRGPIENVFHYVSDARTFPDWFGVFKEVASDDPDGPVMVGTHTTARVKALLPYVLDWDITVSRYVPSTLLETAVKLSLNGRFGMHGYVRYTFQELADNVVLVTNEQRLVADKPLPRMLHGVAQAAFAFNHDWAMRQAQAPLQALVRNSSLGWPVAATV
ncbi:MAG: hypothetical protein JO352_35165 [Chloroflexi bacterium]|nr:hypothetical protein [Chloroflexota bacterium]